MHTVGNNEGLQLLKITEICKPLKIAGVCKPLEVAVIYKPTKKIQS